MKKAFLLAVFAALLVVPSASALSKNNNGATLNTSPEQPIAGDSVTFSGCGYQPSFGFTLTVQADNKTGAQVFGVAVYTDSSGCLIAAEPFVPSGAGNWYAAVWFGNGHRVASLNFTVG